jgi:hypothetical protein
MASPTPLLSADGKASIATGLLMSHHAFRRDLALFARALKDFDASRAAALLQEWTFFRGALHGHHEQEDARMFPMIAGNNPNAAAAIEKLGAQHKQIDPLLDRGDRAFAALETSTADAIAVVDELAVLLGEHLGAEEPIVAPVLRNIPAFPPPGSDAEADMYAQGFAWSEFGIAPEVLDAIDAILPPVVRAKLPAARAAFEDRAKRVWGSAKAGASKTSIPDWLL